MYFSNILFHSIGELVFPLLQHFISIKAKLDKSHGKKNDKKNVDIHFHAIDSFSCIGISQGDRIRTPWNEKRCSWGGSEKAELFSPRNKMKRTSTQGNSNDKYRKKMILISIGENELRIAESGAGLWDSHQVINLSFTYNTKYHLIVEN